MRAFLDTNVYISYLLAPGSDAPPALVVRAGLRGRYVLITSSTVLDEIRTKTTTKPYLASRILAAEFAAFERLLMDTAVIVPAAAGPLPAVVRDEGDDFLVVDALFGRADYLVSGDADLTSLGRIGTVAVVDPARFLAVLRGSGAV